MSVSQPTPQTANRMRFMAYRIVPLLITVDDFKVIYTILSLKNKGTSLVFP